MVRQGALLEDHQEVHPEDRQEVHQDLGMETVHLALDQEVLEDRPDPCLTVHQADGPDPRGNMWLTDFCACVHGSSDHPQTRNNQNNQFNHSLDLLSGGKNVLSINDLTR